MWQLWCIKQNHIVHIKHKYIFVKQLNLNIFYQNNMSNLPFRKKTHTNIDLDLLEHCKKCLKWTNSYQTMHSYHMVTSLMGWKSSLPVGTDDSSHPIIQLILGKSCHIWDAHPLRAPIHLDLDDLVICGGLGRDFCWYQVGVLPGWCIISKENNISKLAGWCPTLTFLTSLSI